MDNLNGSQEFDDLDMHLLEELAECKHTFHEVKRYAFKGVVFIVWRCKACARRTVSRKP